MDRIPGEDDLLDVDLRHLDDSFAEAPLDDNHHYGEIPDGDYQVNIDRVELKTTKSTRQPMLEWTLKIIGPSCAGRLLWRRNMMVTSENLRWLKRDLHTCGLDLGRLSDLPAHLEQLLDVQLEITKRTRGDYENVYLNERLAVVDDGERGSF